MSKNTLWVWNNVASVRVHPLGIPFGYTPGVSISWWQLSGTFVALRHFQAILPHFPISQQLNTTTTTSEMARRRSKTVGKKRPVEAVAQRTRIVGGRRIATPPKGRVVKARRYRPGTVALREIRKYQKSTDLLIRRKPFGRLVKEICAQVCQDNNLRDKRFRKSAMEALQAAAEDYLTKMFSSAQCCAMHGGRTTIKVSDLRLLQQLNPDAYCSKQSL